ncbi:hypothetical protein NBT05_01640 [Aquimarina sp. ERC-38]|uniref:hypothetical protein n=1 Tax=Aquimarina sp. ERC-38 TaxID=2949996 RepID=UPI002248110B|nr:hypothetical protein [Aquimarina sp. ERC-38]UZO81189.1 hypothetical protein NBT05_01640 [Aquimarina sp. ERC-38]
MRKILLLPFVCIVQIVVAQLPQSLIEPTKKVVMFEEYEGSIYNSLKFSNASVIDEKSGTFEAKLRYNIYLDIIEHKNENGLYKLVTSPTTHARIDNNYHYYCEFRNQRGLKQSGYYILVELNERYRIYKKYDLDIRNPVKKSASINVLEPGKIRKEVTYYLEERGTIMELPVDKKEMLAVFSDKADDLKSYMKSEKIKLRKEEDLVRLVSRYNSLKSDGNLPARTLLSNSR